MKKQLNSKILWVPVLIILLISGYWFTQAHGESPEPDLTTPLNLLSSAPIPQGETRAGWEWWEGIPQYSNVQDCSTSYWTYGMSTWVGYLQNAEEGHPAVNEVYYVSISAFGIGMPCGGILTYLTFHLPPSTSLAISPTTPMYCFWLNQEQSDQWQPYTCDITLEQLAPGHYAIPSGDEDLGNCFPLPAGVGWQFRIPVVTSAALNNEQFIGEVRNIDAFSSPPWLFPTVPIYVWAGAATPPGAFTKTSPADAAAGVATSPTLTWETSSGATAYSYCVDDTDDNACANWVDNGTATSATLSGLAGNTTYFWHVRAENSSGQTYANGSSTAFYSFTTLVTGDPPEPADKAEPADGATGLSTSPTLSWDASTGATSYWYCYDTTDDDACDPWLNNGTATSVTLNGLAANTTYFWQVRAQNDGGMTYTNDSEAAFWSFTTGESSTLPGGFAKTDPADGATDVSTSPTLSWGASSGATTYWYCFDDTDDGACSPWINHGTDTSVTLSDLSVNTTFYWHVRADNDKGETYSNGSETAFWSFMTGEQADTLENYLPLILR